MSTKNNYIISNWWWSNLTLDEKIKFKKIHDNEILNSGTKYFNLVNTIGTRISKLTQSQIDSIRRTSGEFYKSIEEYNKNKIK